MATVPGTYFTKEQLEADLKADKVLDGGYFDSNRMKQIGYVYDVEKKQYDKALAWYILAARENNAAAMDNIGCLYYKGFAVPKSYLCALKWQLKAVELNKNDNKVNNIGLYFQYGSGVPFDKYKALEWYCHSKIDVYTGKLKDEGYHLSEPDKKKTLLQLIKETESILDAEKKKLEEKQHKTQQEIEAHVDLKIIYKLVDGGNDAWENIPILLANDKQRYTKQASNLVVNNGNEILEHQIKEKDKELGSLRGDKQPLQMGNSTVQQQIARNDSKINSLQSENQEQKLRIISLEYQLKEKDKKINSLQSKTNEMELLRQNMERQLADEKTRNEVLERENRVLKQERAPDQTNTQSTSRLNNDTINPTNAESNHGGDDDNAHNDINYDSEYDATEESDNDENNDINYDTPSEDEKT